MDVLLARRSLETHRVLLERATAADDVRWITVDDDATLHVDGAEQVLDPTEARPEVAWMTSEVLAGDLARRFFGVVTRSDSLRWLQSQAAGFDHPVFGDLVRRGVRLTASHIAGPPIADFVLRAALDHLQDAAAWRAAAAEGRWEPHDFVEMGSTRWLVIGLGAIGGEIAVRARAFGAEVVGVRRAPTGEEPVDAMVTPDDVSELLPSANVVVLATPANAGTVGLVDRAFLERMRSDALLVNIGRGALVDEDALLAALDAGRPAAAALDVTAVEPLPADHPLWSHPRVAITPHSSAQGDGRHERAAHLFAENLARYTAGEALRHEVTVDDLDP
jgi:phosphoglycerate dehydrogenase-like enzyme